MPEQNAAQPPQDEPERNQPEIQGQEQNQGEAQQPAVVVEAPSSIAHAYNVGKEYVEQNKGEKRALILAGVLLATTALTPAMTVPALAMGALAASVYTLTKSSDILVNNVSAITHRKALSGAITGVILGAMTSMPELAASMGALLQNSSGISMENIVGSNIANPLLVLGATAVIAPIAVTQRVTNKFNAYALIGTAATFGTLCMFGALPGLVAGGLTAGFLGYSFYMAKKDTPDQHVEAEEVSEKEQRLRGMPGLFNAGWGLAGLTGLLASASVMVASAQSVAVGFGVPETVVGPLMVALGTSLPELAVSLNAAMKGKTETAFYNVIGSNIMNVLMVGGLTGVAAAAFTGTGITMPETLNPFTMLGALNLGMLGVGTGLLARSLLKNEGISQAKGILWTGLYGAFVYASLALGGDAPANESAAELETQPLEQAQAVEEEKSPVQYSVGTPAYSLPVPA